MVNLSSSINYSDGVVIASTSAIAAVKSGSQRLYVEVQLHYRYGPESGEITDVPTKKTVCLAQCQLFPGSEERLCGRENKWQQGLVRKFPTDHGVCPFSLILPMGAPPSVVFAQAAGVTTDPCALIYYVVAYIANDGELSSERRYFGRLGLGEKKKHNAHKASILVIYIFFLLLGRLCVFRFASSRRDYPQIY